MILGREDPLQEDMVTHSSIEDPVYPTKTWHGQINKLNVLKKQFFDKYDTPHKGSSTVQDIYYSKCSISFEHHP